MPDEVVETPFGKFLVTRGELIGETTRAGTLWDGPGFLQPLAREHGELGTRGVTILDVGANQGAFSVWLAKQGAWRVIAVEPVPVVMQRLKANLDLNPWCADVVVPLELAAYDTFVWLAASPLDPGNWGGTTLRVAERGLRGLPLDAYRWCFGDRVSLIKVDAQGCDAAAIVGLGTTIRADHPAIIFEWDAALAEPHSWSLDGLLAWLHAEGYAVHEWPSHRNNFVATVPRIR